MLLCAGGKSRTIYDMKHVREWMNMFPIWCTDLRLLRQFRQEPQQLASRVQCGGRSVWHLVAVTGNFQRPQVQQSHARHWPAATFPGKKLIQDQATSIYYNLYGSLWFVVVRTYHPNRRINPDKWPLGRKSRKNCGCTWWGSILIQYLSIRTEGKSKWLSGPSQYIAWNNNSKLCAIWQFLEQMNNFFLKSYVKISM